jgi:hypothetical protein
MNGLLDNGAAEFFRQKIPGADAGSFDNLL